MPINLDSSVVSLVTTSSGETFAGLAPLIALVIAVPMLFYVARRIQNLLPHKH
jgi:hypothetical protein